MKKAYTKPMIYVEVMELDQPIAMNCSADPNVIRELKAQGWFGPGCDFEWMDGVEGSYGSGVGNGSDTVCYNSNVTIAFTS